MLITASHRSPSSHHASVFFMLRRPSDPRCLLPITRSRRKPSPAFAFGLGSQRLQSDSRRHHRIPGRSTGGRCEHQSLGRLRIHALRRGEGSFRRWGGTNPSEPSTHRSRCGFESGSMTHPSKITGDSAIITPSRRRRAAKQPGGTIILKQVGNNWKLDAAYPVQSHLPCPKRETRPEHRPRQKAGHRDQPDRHRHRFRKIPLRQRSLSGILEPFSRGVQ